MPVDDPLTISPTLPLPNDGSPSPRKLPQLPPERVLDIITYIKHNRQYATLAKMAQANSTFYDLVIPQLYETITITKTNMHKIKYGFGHVDASSPSPSSEATIIVADESSYSSTDGGDSDKILWTRKDRAIEHCLRLITNVPLDKISGSLEWFAERLPCHRFGNVEELVSTRRASVAKSHRHFSKAGQLPDILSPADQKHNDDESEKWSTKTKRVVIHLSRGRPTRSHCHDHLLYQIDAWCRLRRDEHRTPTQFVCHGIDLEVDGYHLTEMDAECHFTQPLRSQRHLEDIRIGT